MPVQVFGASLLFSISGYLLGSIVFGIIVTRIVRKVDIRTIGSRNAGATNVARNYGLALGASVLVLDLLKPLLAMIIASLLKRYATGSFFTGGIVDLAGVGAVVGHAFPLFFKFRGGKGSATTIGMFMATSWILGLVFLVLFGLFLLWKKRVSIASISVPVIMTLGHIGYAFIPGALESTWVSPLVFGFPWWVSTICLAVVTILVIYMHRTNIRRLIKGEEQPFARTSK